jgi:hypothetical protein
MKKRRGAAQIVGLLRQADVALGKGEKVPEVCKELGISWSRLYLYFRERLVADRGRASRCLDAQNNSETIWR